jgi:hypothetical protein
MTKQPPLTDVQIQAIRELLAARPAEPNPSTLAGFWLLGAAYIERLLGEIETLKASDGPEVDTAAQAFVASAVAWRQRVNLVPASPLTQEMLDKLDALVILLAGSRPQ